MRCVVNKRGQVWVETVIYTLIGLTIIGLVLAVALPKINEKKDEVMIDQAIQALGTIDDNIYWVQRAPGNRYPVDLDIGRGRLIVDVDENSISWVLDSSFEYSQAGIDVRYIGNMIVSTKEANPWEVTLKINYAEDIQFEGVIDGTKELDSAPTPYKLMIENAGKNEDGNLIIRLSVS